MPPLWVGLARRMFGPFCEADQAERLDVRFALAGDCFAQSSETSVLEWRDFLWWQQRDRAIFVRAGLRARRCESIEWDLDR